MRSVQAMHLVLLQSSCGSTCPAKDTMVQQAETSLAVQSHAGFQLWINLPAKDKMMKPRLVLPPGWLPPRLWLPAFCACTLFALPCSRHHPTAHITERVRRSPARYQDYQAEDIPVAEKDGASGGPLSPPASLRPCMLGLSLQSASKGGSLAAEVPLAVLHRDPLVCSLLTLLLS